MRPTPWLLVEPYRTQTPGYESRYGDPGGAFEIPYRGVRLRVIACDGRDSHAWDHASVSLPRRIPNWLEMAFVKGLFWGEDETVMQLHVPAAEHINLHPHVLHLWRPLLLPIPMPPTEMV